MVEHTQQLNEDTIIQPLVHDPNKSGLGVPLYTQAPLDMTYRSKMEIPIIFIEVCNNLSEFQDVTTSRTSNDS